MACLGTPVLTAGPVPSNKPAAFPNWWFEQDVIVRTNTANNSPVWPVDYPASDDYSVLNQGQLKNLAAKAAAELNTQLPGGAGTAINNLLVSWGSPPAPGVTRDDYASVNQGQLKALAKLFYDCLIAAGYTNAYPWSGTTSDDDNYAAANLGQAKHLFDFDLSAPAGQLPAWWISHYFPGQGGILPTGDPDGDGLSNLHEYQQSSDPKDYFSQGSHTVTPRIFAYSGGGVSVPLGEYSADPIVYKVVDAATGEKLVNAPVTISVNEGTGLLALTRGGATQTSFAFRTDPDGFVKVYFKVP